MTVTVRNKAGLHPSMLPFMDRFEVSANKRKLDVLFHCTLRTNREQAILYRQGRSLWQIKARADDLWKLYGRQDLADILMGVGPQKGDRIKTNAAPGQSMHQYGMAADGCPIWQGKLIYDGPEDYVPDVVEAELWAIYGECVEEAGLEWAGRWKGKLREMPHAQMPGVDWHDLIKFGRA